MYITYLYNLLQRHYHLKFNSNFSWRKLHKEELHILYSSPNIIKQIKSRRMRSSGHVACMGEEKNVYNVMVEKPKGKRPLGRPRHR
jgi:hypothetical protein